jgi:hypothetical protein
MRRQNLSILPLLFFLFLSSPRAGDFKSLSNLIHSSTYLTQDEKNEWLKALSIEFFTQSLKPGDAPRVASAYRIISYGMRINRLPPERVVRAARLTTDSIIYLGANPRWAKKIGIIAFWEDLTAPDIALGARLMGKIEGEDFSPSAEDVALDLLYRGLAEGWNEHTLEAILTSWGQAAEQGLEISPKVASYTIDGVEGKKESIQRVIARSLSYAGRINRAYSQDSHTHLGRYEGTINRAAYKYRLKPQLIAAVIHTESGFYPYALSRKGAVGLMQLMPRTALEMGVDPWDAEENVHGGAKYLRYLLDRFRGNLELALAAYNAGPENVGRYRGVPPFAETVSYVKRVLSIYRSGSL